MNDYHILGNFKSFTTDSVQQRVCITGEGGALYLAYMACGAVQVTALRDGQAWTDFSYSVADAGQLALPTLHETTDKLYMELPTMRVVVGKYPLRVRFETLETDEIILADDEGLGIVWDGTEVTNYKQLHEGERFMGLGEKTGHLDKRGCQYVNWNTDQFAYYHEGDPLYASIPFYIGLNDNKPYGVFLDNTSRTTFNFGASNHRFHFFQAERGLLRYYFFYTGNVAGIVESYTQLSGRMPLPPLWSIGFQQCRYSYFPDTEVLSTARMFRERSIPADVIYLDIHYMDRCKVFTWHPERFADPAKLVAELREMGFHVVVILDPGIKIDVDYDAYVSGVSEDVFLAYPDGSLYEGEAWPGKCHFPDFTKSSARAWWARQIQTLADIGIDGFWNDMNEPAVWGKSFPDVVRFNYEGQQHNHKLAHNVYGAQMARSTYEGAERALPNRRSFVLTRSAFAGSQVHTAIWTGDNCSNTEHLLLGSRLVSNLGLCGMPFAGNDVGGFVGESSIELFMKWVGQGAFTPLFRCHTMVNSRDAEPWSFGEEAEAVSRAYIQLRYRLLPSVYSYFYEASTTGMPVSRSMAIKYYHLKEIFNPLFENQYFFGDALLVCPVPPSREVHKLFLPPQDIWYDMYTDTLAPTGTQWHEVAKELLPVFVKGGSLLVLQSSIQSTAEKPHKVLELHVYKGTIGSIFTYYEDDGVSYAYQHEEAYYLRKITYDAAQGVLHFSEATGSYASHFEVCRVYLHGFDAEVVYIAEQVLNVQKTNYRFLDPISNFDPFWGDSEDLRFVANLQFVEIGWSMKSFELVLGT
jgi:alpha-glucosidase